MDIKTKVVDDDKEWEEQERQLEKVMDAADAEQKMLKLYSHFSNFPRDTKMDIIRNICIVIGLTVFFFFSIFRLKYSSPVLYVAYITITVFLLWKVFATFFYLKHVHFITFTGKVVEAFAVGTKITGSKHWVVKLRSEEGRELCFPYYGSQKIYYDQNITLFINNQAEVDLSQWGPYISKYIEAIPTEEIETRLKFFDENAANNIKVQDYLKQ